MSKNSPAEELREFMLDLISTALIEASSEGPIRALVEQRTPEALLAAAEQILNGLE